MLQQNVRLFTYYIFFDLVLLSRTLTIRRTAGEREGYLFDSSLQLPSASQTLRHYPGFYCRKLTSAHTFQPDLYRKTLDSECNSPTTLDSKCNSLTTNTLLDGNQRFDRIKSIHWDRLVNIGWLGDIDLLNAKIWFV